MTVPPELRAAIDAWEQRALAPDEFAARIAQPMSPREREDFHELVSWFVRRYPTAGERMRAMRRRLAQLRVRTRS